jgi:DNA replication and repair protein RecF
MALTWLRVEQFRCFEKIELDLDPQFNFFVGANASGKTSLLEALFFLGRGRSFRSRRLESLIRQGQREFLVVGKVRGEQGSVTLGVRGARDGSEIRVAGKPAQGAAQLAEYFPPQVIDPEIHKLLEEGPGRRRRFLDWGVFHVEPAFLDTWQRYHKALRQRNAALKLGQADDSIRIWDAELATAGEQLSAQRRSYLEALAAPLKRIGQRLLGADVATVYHRGWPEEASLADRLQQDLERDRRYRATQHGPHRSDVVIRVEGHNAKDRVSRGQQKLLAAGLTLAQLDLQEQERPGRSALLLDDPAAELDVPNLERLLNCVRALPVQLVVTSLREDVPGLPGQGARFHVEHGQVVPKGRIG